ncbi:MAG: EpsG family protein [Proteobacteria bacterium]|nr:EpsG family protein [Pseudomonadota bacterium]
MDFRVSKRKIFVPLVALIAAFFLSLMPWDKLRGSEYYDRNVYVNYIDNVSNKINWFDFDGILTKITFEYGWHFILKYCTEVLQLNSTIILFIISFLIFFCSSIFVIKRHGYWACIFLLNPVFIDFCYSQMRLAFTMALIYIAYYFRTQKKFIYIPLLAVTPFIHTSSVLFIFLFVAATHIEKLKFPANFGKTNLAVICGLMVAVVTGPLMSIILGGIGDRRAEYADFSSPILYMAFYLVLFPYFLLKGYLEKSDKDFTFYFTIMILSLIALNTVFSGYSSRFLAATFPIIISALLSLKGKEKPIILISYIAFTSLLWIFWLT